MGVQFSAGDLVQLKSGGPAMTVNHVHGDMVHAAWFVGGKINSGHFNPEALVPYKGKKEPDK